MLYPRPKNIRKKQQTQIGSGPLLCRETKKQLTLVIKKNAFSPKNKNVSCKNTNVFSFFPLKQKH